MMFSYFELFFKKKLDVIKHHVLVYVAKIYDIQMWSELMVI